MMQRTDDVRLRQRGEVEPSAVAPSVRARGARRLQALQLALCVLTLLALGLGSITLYAGLSLGLSADLRDELYTGTADAKERALLARWRSDLLPIWDAGVIYDDLAQIVLADAVEKGIHTPDGRKMMPEVLRLEAEALRRNPANAYAWARLAYARYIYNGPSQLVTEPLLQSIQSSPYEPPLLASRIVLALRTEKYWSPQMKEWFPQQLERAWLRESAETVRAAYDDGIELWLREKIANDPQKLARYEEIMKDLRSASDEKP